MKGKKTDLGGSSCAIARSLNVIGDWWSLLIIRDALAGTRRFGEFQSRLGLAKNILTTRLRKLVDAGILATAPAQDGSAYKEYQPTPKGEDLYLVFLALWQWGEKHMFAPGEQAQFLVDKRGLQPIAPLQALSSDGQPIGPHDYLQTSRKPSTRRRKAASD